MKVLLRSKRKITAGDAVKMLAKNGVVVDEAQAGEILELLYVLAELEVKAYLKDDENSGFIHKGEH